MRPDGHVPSIDDSPSHPVGSPEMRAAVSVRNGAPPAGPTSSYVTAGVPVSVPVIWVSMRTQSSRT